MTVGIRGELVLGSASPRRRELLSQLQVPFILDPSDAEEPPFLGGDPADYALELAQLKAAAVAEREEHRGRWVLGADTIVVRAGEVLGKPVDDGSAAAMLEKLAGAEHDVITAVCLIGPMEEGARSFYERTRVYFRPLERSAIERYVASGEGRDKAGSYAIQGLGAGLVSRIEGSYSNVVGLPTSQTIDLLMQAGVLTQWP